MYLTVTLRARSGEYHVEADDSQPIRAVAEALGEAFGVFGRDGFPLFFKSELQRTLCSSYFTFRQAGVQNGDILTAME